MRRRPIERRRRSPAPTPARRRRPTGSGSRHRSRSDRRAARRAGRALPPRRAPAARAAGGCAVLHLRTAPIVPRTECRVSRASARARCARGLPRRPATCACSASPGWSPKSTLASRPAASGISRGASWSRPAPATRRKRQRGRIPGAGQKPLGRSRCAGAVSGRRLATRPATGLSCAPLSLPSSWPDC
jgi:hypothetical protein